MIDGILVNDKYDAERGKFSALFSRGMPRDYYDAYYIANKLGIDCKQAINMSEFSGDRKRVEFAFEHFKNIDRSVFIDQYGMSKEEIENMEKFLNRWFLDFFECN